MIKFLLTGITIAALTGCAVSGHYGDYAKIEGSPKGLKALYDGMNGALKTAKESNDAPNQFFQFRAKEESEITKRELKPGFLDGLFSRNQKQETMESGS